jgi:arylsulfatase A-like enzyme
MTSPNILFILVDEMRYPMHFPPGVSSAGEFLQKFMPHTYRLLWNPGVRFHNAYTAASDCTPARGTIVTGLYAQQTFCMTTRANRDEPQSGVAIQPPLHPGFPTYGKILREAGYDTPYIGKWHLSNFPEHSQVPYLEDYGFEGLTLPDPVSLPGQGYGATPPAEDRPMPFGDPQIANQAVGWLQARAASDAERNKPFCLTVGFGNPHDKQYFWGGVEVSRFMGMYAEAGAKPTLPFTTNIVHQMYPPPYYTQPAVNWTQKDRMTMTLHEVFREFFAGAVGDSAEHPTEGTGFIMRPSANKAAPPVAVAPFAYWAKGMDMYAQALHDVDEQIAQVIENIPDSLRDNTVIVFTSDHGEYASSHGLQGKGFTAYEETMRVPLIFTDLTGRYGASTQDRVQYTSSVDLLPLFANLAYGNNSWSQSDELRGLYDGRNDLLSVILTNSAVIRDYSVFTCDEVLTGDDNYLSAPEHVLAFTDFRGKLGIYSHWSPGQATPLATGQELEYYDYAKDRLEMENEPAKGTSAASRLLNDILPNEIQRPMPTQALRDAQAEALELYWKYVDLATADPPAHRFAHLL